MPSALAASLAARQLMRRFTTPWAFSSCRVCRVSSAATMSTALRVSRARSVMSPRLPMGVATTYSSGTPIGTLFSRDRNDNGPGESVHGDVEAQIGRGGFLGNVQVLDAQSVDHDVVPVDARSGGRPRTREGG